MAFPQPSPELPESPAPRGGADGPDVTANRVGDRRDRSTPRLSRFTFSGGRRRHVRRDEEREGSFVDLYSPIALLPILWVALMNAADSFFTLHHLQSGGIELNPVAAAMLETGRLGFVLCKATLITLALLVLSMHKNFFLARLGLIAAVTTYTVLVAYHLWLL